MNEIKAIFKDLASIEYVYLRDTMYLRKVLSSSKKDDIDLLILRKDVHKVAKIMEKNGFLSMRPYKKHSRGLSFSHYKHADWPYFDIQVERINKMPYIPGFELIAHRKKENGIYVLDDEYKLLVLVCKDLLLTGIGGLKRYSNSKKKEMLKLYKNNREFLKNKIKFLGSTIVKYLDAGTPERISDRRRFLQLNAVFHPSFVLQMIVYLYHQLSFRRRHTIVFMGVDGAGKTTALKMAEKILDSWGIKYKSIYLGRWIKMGQVNKLSKKMRSSNSAIFKRTKPIARDILYIIKYWYLYLKMLFYRISGNNIIGDRYIYDLKIEKDYCRFFNIFIDWLFPKPNLLVYLHADPKKIYARKGQWGIEELARHQEIYKKISDSKNGVMIRTDDIKKTEWDVARTLAKKFSCNLYQ